MSNLNFNRVILGGHITSDPELRTTPSGTTVTTFSVAVNRRIGKDQQQKTDFVTCTAWRTTAEFIARYFHKGSSIFLVGNLQQRSWEDKDGNKRYATEVVVDEAHFVDSKNEAASAPTAQPMTYIPKAYKPQQPQQMNFEEMKNDDDLPF